MIGIPFIVHFHDDEVLSIVEDIRHVKIKRREASHMFPYPLAIHINYGLVIDSAEVKNGLLSRLGMIGETLLKPYCPLVELQLWVLGVPVRRDVHRLRLVKIIFYQVGRGFRLRIVPKGMAHWFPTIIIIADLLNVNDIIPFSIQGDTLPCKDIRQQGNFLGSIG